jgi:predicted DCC family thiol-disulfide oxidoreductase YuxK
MCTRFVQGIKLLDTKGELHFESIHNEMIYDIYENISFVECEKEVHLLLEDRILKGSEVIEYLVLKMPGVKKLSWLIESNAGKSAVNSFYKKLNTMRLNMKKGCRTCK